MTHEERCAKLRYAVALTVGALRAGNKLLSAETGACTNLERFERYEALRKRGHAFGQKYSN